MLNVCFSFNVFSQGFIKYFGGNLDDIGYSVIESNDGGVVIAGETSSYGNGGSDVYLIKTDEYGDTLWTKTFGGNSVGRDVAQTYDGGYIITGFTGINGGNPDAYLIKTNSIGDTLWTETYGSPGWDKAYSVIEVLQLNWFL